MQKVKIEDAQNPKEIKPTVEHYTNYKGRPMVRIKGNFYGGGFNLSRNKLLAVVENYDELQAFIKGEFDNEIKELQEGEVLKP